MNKEIENGIIFLVENFFRKNSLYLVGSGISIKYAKTILATKTAIKTSIFNSGSFSDVERLRKPMQCITDYILKCMKLRTSAEVLAMQPTKKEQINAFI